MRPAGQSLVAALMGHFERRIVSGMGRSPLAHFTIGATTPRIDVSDLGTPIMSANALVNHVLSRVQRDQLLDPSGYLLNHALANRLRRMISNAAMFRRDTGIDARYLAFPFLVIRDGITGSSAKMSARVAPVLLWPVDIETVGGLNGSVKLAFDSVREEVKLNPALESILGTKDFEAWDSLRKAALDNDTATVSSIMTLFGNLATPVGTSLQSVPNPTSQLQITGRALIPAAALFNAEFTAQAIASDLNQLKGRQVAGTALAPMMRLDKPSLDKDIDAHIPEVDRYSIVERDPSQDQAVLKSRQKLGLVVEGPPGTGKSQTIVNIVADAIGRGEKVLVICQKQAALQVVQKRLANVQLDGRLFMIVDVNGDRVGTVTALRSQIAALHATHHMASPNTQARAQIAGYLETVERDIDRHHSILHEIDPISGLSYRLLIGDLIRVEASGPYIEAPRLRGLLGTLSKERVEEIGLACGPIASLWLDAKFEGNALQVMRPASFDQALATQFEADLRDFATAEERRLAAIAVQKPTYELDDVSSSVEWLRQHRTDVSAMTDEDRRSVAAWLPLFKAEGANLALGDIWFCCSFAPPT
jgi:hypothetical protein